jgi:hypothetical protein
MARQFDRFSLVNSAREKGRREIRARKCTPRLAAAELKVQIRRINAPVGGERVGITATAGRAFETDGPKQGAYSCIARLGLTPGKVGVGRVAGNSVLTAQQLVCMDAEDSCRMQQLCALLGPGCRQKPSGASISPTRRMAIEARWKEPRNIAISLPRPPMHSVIEVTRDDKPQPRSENVQSCGLVMLREPDGFGQRQAGSLCANDGMRLPKSH